MIAKLKENKVMIIFIMVLCIIGLIIFRLIYDTRSSVSDDIAKANSGTPSANIHMLSKQQSEPHKNIKNAFITAINNLEKSNKIIDDTGEPIDSSLINNLDPYKFRKDLSDVYLYPLIYNDSVIGILILSDKDGLFESKLNVTRMRDVFQNQYKHNRIGYSKIVSVDETIYLMDGNLLYALEENCLNKHIPELVVNLVYRWCDDANISDIDSLEYLGRIDKTYGSWEYELDLDEGAFTTNVFPLGCRIYRKGKTKVIVEYKGGYSLWEVSPY